jgi:hypothetical protein
MRIGRCLIEVEELECEGRKKLKNQLLLLLYLKELREELNHGNQMMLDILRNLLAKDEVDGVIKEAEAAVVIIKYTTHVSKM